MSGKPFEGLGGGPLARGLAWVYGVGRLGHAALRRRHLRHIAVPVVSVGNLVVGGTGKTPLTAAIARELGRDRKVAVVSRGYGGNERGPARAHGDGDPARMGDEPVELAGLAPDARVWVAREREAGAEAAIRDGAQLVLLDDGFAYIGLHRDVDLLVFDQRGVGNGRLLPAGPLREPLRAMTRAHGVLLRGDAVVPPGWEGPVFRFDVVADGFADLQGNVVERPAEAVGAAGIAWPARFFGGLESQGIRLRHTFALTDHAPWPPSLIKKVERAADGLPIVVTGKDAVKLRRYAPPGLWLQARQRVDMDAAFWPWLRERATLRQF